MTKKSQIEEVAEICKKDEEEKSKQYLNDSNKRLFKIISTKLTTSNHYYINFTSLIQINKLIPTLW